MVWVRDASNRKLFKPGALPSFSWGGVLPVRFSKNISWDFYSFVTLTPTNTLPYNVAIFVEGGQHGEKYPRIGRHPPYP